jgi:isopenicillin N synthase-like dioxygenase|eukprot:gene13414-9605_t
MSREVKIAEVVTLDYNDLVAGKDLTAEIERAYGDAGMGLLTVKNVPSFIEARERLLPLARRFATLPDEVKAKYEHPESFYAFGWSHGKEKLQGGKFDVSKGSFYNNPQYDEPVNDAELIRQYPSFVHPNIWPKDDLPEMEAAFKELGQIIVSVGILVAKQCDAYVSSKCPTYPAHMLQRIIEESLCCKARLLHYFPQTEEQVASANSEDFSNWCGWHNDHGSLTGLAPGMLLDAEGNPAEGVADPDAGLYCMSRSSELYKVNIPKDHMGFQIGETAQIHSGGYLQATPHSVRGARVPNISRESFAVFMEPMWMEPAVCPAGVDPAKAQSQSAALNLPQGVPPLASRWIGRDASHPEPMTFGEFSDATHKAYY